MVRKRQSVRKTRRVRVHGQSMVCKPVGGKRALKKCIVNTMQRMKFTTAKGARKAFASATKKCRKQLGTTRVVRRKRKTTRRKSTYRSKTQRIAPYYRKQMQGIRPDLW